MNSRKYLTNLVFVFKRWRHYAGKIAESEKGYTYYLSRKQHVGLSSALFTQQTQRYINVQIMNSFKFKRVVVSIDCPRK